ncbi:anaerobic ribonucleoside-triphosphate reductase [Vibrio phage 1.031.O._10N.261.46.F8]|nr:anaerobic ribonucleoside-triphosphate reductase [Vibrio phage 1.031.O._10N.261.46.F8]
MIRVIKRDGKTVEFDRSRIEIAVNNAANSAGLSKLDADLLATKVANGIASLLGQLKHTDELHIHEIQNMVEASLMQQASPEVAREYITYRHDRDQSRDMQSELTKEVNTLFDLSNKDVINENANKDGRVIPTQRDLLAGIVSKHYARTLILPAEVVSAHDEGLIHFHDMDYSPLFPNFNCMLVDLDEMLTNGFKMGAAEIESPKSIHTAANVTAQIIAQVASHTYGGTTINRIDEVLAKYVTLSYVKHRDRITKTSIACGGSTDSSTIHTIAMKDTEKEVYDAFQSLEYEVNTLHTANGQTPFVTFGFGLGTSWQSKMIQSAILKVRIAGLGKNKKTAVFPKLVYAIRDGHNHKSTDPLYDIKQLALECATKRMYPDILNYDKLVEVTGGFKTPMGCRSFLGEWVDPKTGEPRYDGRNNLGVVSLNLVRVAILADGDWYMFLEELQKALEVCKTALMERIRRFDGVQAKVAPILYCEGALGVRMDPEDYVADLFKDGRASISLGYIGIHEALNALFGEKKDCHPFDDAGARDFGQRIVRELRLAVDCWKEETGYGFSLYSTPSENLCNRFCRLDLEEFGEISGVTDKGYYTNSYHLDVQKKVSPYDKIDFEMAYPAIASGGFINYVEFPNLIHNPKALEQIWDYTYKRVPYFGTNTPIDHCYECDYQGEFTCTSEGYECPQCGNNNPSKVSVTRRVCGYLGAPDARPFNAGKQNEVMRRVKHM